MVHSKFQDLVPVHLKDEGDPDLLKPDEEEIEEVHITWTCYIKCVCSNNVVQCSVFFNRSHDSH